MISLREIQRVLTAELQKLLPDRDFAKLLHNWKLLTARKVIFFPHVINKQEKRFLLLGLIVTLAAGSTFFSRIYFRNTMVVPDVGDTHVEGMLREPRNINPIYVTTDGDRDIAKLIFSRLLNYNGRGEVVSDLAEAYEISGDGKTYTLRLRQNAKWHCAHGRPIIGRSSGPEYCK
jgi:hypothetical protein